MTIGSKPHGTSTDVVTTSGPGTVRYDYGTRVWNGVDYPVSKPIKTQALRTMTYERVRVHRGKEIVTTVIKRKLVNVVARPPKRIRTGEHAYTMSDFSHYDTVFSYANHPGGPVNNSGTGRNTGYANFTGSFQWNSNDELALLGRLREKVAGSDFNAGVFLGEGREALGMITNAANRLYKALKAVKKGNFHKAAEALTKGTSRYVPHRKVGASNWLQLQYGWLPLLNDAHDGAVFLAHHFEHPLQHVVRVSYSKPGTVDSSVPFVTAGSSRCYTRVDIKAILREKDVAALSGLTDPLSVAWELVPYSFVIDWFIPIGNYLSARGLSSSLSGTFVTSKKNFFEAGSPVLRPDVSYLNPTAPYYSIRYRSVDFTRTVSTTLKVPTPQIKSLSQAFSWKRAANALALLSQLR